MVIGVGIDIVDINRITPLNEKLVEKILTEKEQEVLLSLKTDVAKIEFFGGRFAAKEAFSKAIGTGIGELSFKDCEVIGDNLGRPVMKCESYANLSIHLSISHSDASIVAVVVLEDKK